MEPEIVACLSRYLPVGMEGVAAAQARGLLAILGRAGAGDRQPVGADARAGMRALRHMAMAHRPPNHRKAARECPVCRQAPTSAVSAPWPCQVWDAALAVGVVSPEDAPPPG